MSSRAVHQINSLNVSSFNTAKDNSRNSVAVVLQAIAVANGLQAAHQSFPSDNPPPFTQIRQLGCGSLGSVDEIRIPNSAKTLARKSILLSGVLKHHYMEIIGQEVKALRNLSHPHIVQVAGTYEFGPCYAILMSPVGDQSLKDMLEEYHDRANQANERPWLQTWFHCLSSALAHIHSQGIRHEDIKPSNIIHRRGDVYLTDFSSCTEFEFGRTTSTDTPAGRITRIYSAPEGLEDERHGSSVDIFSMGCVFTEMATVVDGRPVSEFYRHCSVNRWGSQMERMYYSEALGRIDEWFDDALYMRCIRPMLAKDRRLRPTARKVSVALEEVLGPPRCACVEEFLGLR
jgi:serine/threonine protein kinase